VKESLVLGKVSLVAIGPVVDWLRRRRERRAMSMATDDLSHSRDDMLSDIGISRDDIMRCALRNREESF
jgi:uncharacterized protein YjiS (DUF1127 family)